MAIDGVRLDGRRLDRAGLREASFVARAAFFNDPFYAFHFPREEFRSKSLSIFFRTVLRHLGPGGRVVTARGPGEHIVGLAVWLPTGAYPQPMWTQLSQLPGLIRSAAHHPSSIASAYAYFKATTKAHPKDPHWYLLVLAVVPPLQGQGIGSMLVSHGLALIDEERVSSYLDTQNKENLAYYRKFGYQLQNTLRPVARGPELYTMLRAPR
jgi:ribosomal protein S18 acetylase RimI-like enzyme